jgi:hypothetical protein
MIEEQYENRYEEVDQPLYSRVMLGGENGHYASFFNTCIGAYNKLGEKIEEDDTNMRDVGHIRQMFTIKAIRFRETLLSIGAREHLLKFGYFTLRIVDKEFLIYPLHLMDSYYYFLEKKLEIPLRINPMESFVVVLRMKPYEWRFQLTCELLGTMHRTIL